MPVQRWATPVSQVELRLRTLQDVLKQAQRPDGTVDLVAAKAIAGTNQEVSALVNQVRPSADSTAMTPDQARRQFMELQHAVRSAKELDHNRDGKLGFEELPYAYTDDWSKAMVMKAATPKELAHERPAPRIKLSLSARQDAEAKITALAEHHAATPEGKEALKWGLRLDLVRGTDVDDVKLLDPIIYNEKSWQRFLPFVGREYREGKGHLSDEELRARYGPDLKTFANRAREQVNRHLLMNYESEFLAGKDLP